MPSRSAFCVQCRKLQAPFCRETLYCCFIGYTPALTLVPLTMLTLCDMIKHVHLSCDAVSRRSCIIIAGKEVTMQKKRFWSPYLAGAVLGATLLATFYSVGHGLGPSGAITLVTAKSTFTIIPEFTAASNFCPIYHPHIAVHKLEHFRTHRSFPGFPCECTIHREFQGLAG